ncbi:sensor histidine kinase [Henriciella algicola]|uniref:histidine kinase n=1 Tax=Henriciella algicola TaxID=1608422 RepID=A0A399RM25_9PROT|nr:ATP-binding protein [Henriciella algicola]RIJ31344.1 PAS domain S-box protein [Henriciella algicola]
MSKGPARKSGIGCYWADLSLPFKGLVLVALPLVILIGSLGSLYIASDAEARAEDDVRRAFAIQRDIYQVHALLAEAASGVRGYLLTDQNRFLEPFYKAERELPLTLARLDDAIEDEGVRLEFERFLEITERKQSGLDALIALARSEGERPARSDAVLSALIANKAVLDELRSQIEEIQRQEGILLDARRARVDTVRARFLALTAISAVVGLLGSLAAVFLFSTGVVRRIRMLQANAEKLQAGDPLNPFPDERDEIGRLAKKVDRASELLRARERDLREGEERFRLVVEGVRDYGIFALDPDGNVTSWNTGAERIKGWRAEEILGRFFGTFYPEETRDYLPREILERARRDGTTEDEGWRMRKDGTRFWANVVVTALRDETGRLRGFAKVTRDMTERKRAEEFLKLAREQAVAASVAKSEFLSRTSHELRTPMSAILGFAQVLELDREELSETHQTSVDQILKAGRHLLSLINDLLDISSIEAGGAELKEEALSINDVLAEAYDLSGPILRTANLDYDLSLLPEDALIMGDRRRIIQVILNLVSNAAKYNREGTSVRITAERVENAVRVHVLDDGTGVKDADISRLFTPFDRLGRQKIKGVEGTGLGLALSKRLVESMGGEIGYTHRTDIPKGADFWFTLGLARAEAAPRKVPSAETSEEQP